MRRNEALDATLEELRAAGYAPEVTYGRHIKVSAKGLPPIIVSVTSSDVHAGAVARRQARKIIAQAR
jgi:hypothetical protein